MMNIGWLIRKIVLTTFKDYRSWLLYIGLPLVAVLFAVITQGNTVQSKINIAIINHDQDQHITQEAIAFITNMNFIVNKEVHPTNIEEQLHRGELDAAITFPKGFADSILTSQPLTTSITSVKRSDAASYIKLNLNHYIDTLVAIANAASGDERQFNEWYYATNTTPISLLSEQIQDYSTHYRKANQTIGYLIIIMLFSAGNLSNIIIKERETRTFYRIVASPIKISSYVLSNIVVNMGVMVTQIVISLLVLKHIFHINTGISYGLMFLGLIIFALVAISFSFVIVAITRTKLEASGLQSLIFLPTSILAGCMFPVEIMPSFMEKIAFFFPQYWLLDTFSNLQRGYTFEESYLNLVILIAFAITFALISILNLSKSNDTLSHI